jgi:hypothetical protein
VVFSTLSILQTLSMLQAAKCRFLLPAEKSNLGIGALTDG